MSLLPKMGEVGSLLHLEWARALEKTWRDFGGQPSFENSSLRLKKASNKFGAIENLHVLACNLVFGYSRFAL